MFLVFQNTKKRKRFLIFLKFLIFEKKIQKQIKYFWYFDFLKKNENKEMNKSKENNKGQREKVTES